MPRLWLPERGVVTPRYECGVSTLLNFALRPAGKH